jgi:sulfur dioxygenase
MAMVFRELNRGKCKTYLLACRKTRQSALVDPVHEHINRYLALLAYYGFTLEAVLDTHTHADHRSACAELSDLTDARIHMHENAPQPRVHIHLHDGDVVKVGKLRISVLYTPGHTPDSVSYYVDERVLTGDTLLIGGTGRTDFAGGDAGAQYDSIMQKLFTLPDDTRVYPAHDYRGNTFSTIGYEKRDNPRIAGRSREDYIQLMNTLDLPLPERIQEVLQINQTELDDDALKFPSIAELNQVRLLEPGQMLAMLEYRDAPIIIDVREPHEYSGDLGHIPGSRLMPLRQLPHQTGELTPFKGKPIVLVCRAGVRSATAAALLTGLGFEQVYNLRGGMLAWNKEQLPIER